MEPGLRFEVDHLSLVQTHQPVYSIDIMSKSTWIPF